MMSKRCSQALLLKIPTSPRAGIYIDDITRRCEDMTFYLRVVKTIFYERAQRVSTILFLTREDKSHIFKPPCNALFII
jgi:hypothetical protein